MVSLMLKRIPIHRFRWLYLIVSLSPNYFTYTYCILLPILIYPHNIGISSRFQVISRVAAPTGLFLWHLFPTRHFDGTLQINCWVIPCAFQEQRPRSCPEDFIAACYTLWRFAMHRVGFQGIQSRMKTSKYHACHWNSGRSWITCTRCIYGYVSKNTNQRINDPGKMCQNMTSFLWSWRTHLGRRRCPNHLVSTWVEIYRRW